MRIFLYIILCLTVASPAYADTFTSRSLQLNGDIPASYRSINLFPDRGLQGEDIMETDSMDPRTSELYAMEEESVAEEEDPDYLDEEEDLDYLEEETEIDVADPLEPVNRIFFQFNDKLYFFVLKPVARGYSAIVPEEIRFSVRNFFTNLATPVRFVNSLLQFKIKAAGTELLRLGINSTFGMLGLYDVARDEMDIKMQDEDFGQTLGVWGAGPVFYINWPFLGPSSLRDSIGLAGDYFLDPVNYVSPDLDRYAIKGGDIVNKTSLVIGDYEEIKKDALDPYAAFRDIYYQYRESRIER